MELPARKSTPVIADVLWLTVAYKFSLFGIGKIFCLDSDLQNFCSCDFVFVRVCACLCVSVRICVCVCVCVCIECSR